MLATYGRVFAKVRDGPGGIAGLASVLERYGAEARADLARAGWSAQADIGGRLRYADAAALISSMASDTSTELGARMAGLRYPCTAADLVGLVELGARLPEFRRTGLYPILSDREVRAREAFKATPGEAAAARRRMAPVFSGLG